MCGLPRLRRGLSGYLVRVQRPPHACAQFGGSHLVLLRFVLSKQRLSATTNERERAGLLISAQLAFTQTAYAVMYRGLRSDCSQAATETRARAGCLCRGGKQGLVLATGLNELALLEVAATAARDDDRNVGHRV